MNSIILVLILVSLSINFSFGNAQSTNFQTWELISAGCNDSSFLTIDPPSVSFLGHEIIQISGILFDIDKEIKVYVENEEIEIVSKNSFYLRCDTKYFSTVGTKLVVVRINENQNYTGNLMVKSIQNNMQINGMEEFYYIDDNLSRNTTITWNKIENSNPENFLFLYNVVMDEHGNTNIYLLKENIPISKTNETINLNEIRDNLKRPKFIGKYWISFIALNRNKISESLSSWVRMQMSIFIDFFDNTCQSWSDKQLDPKQFLESLPACWPQAPDNFPLTFDVFKLDSRCHPTAGSCKYNPGATACYKSATGQSQAQHCCYDKNSILLVGPPSGGTLNMRNPDISIVDHYIEDVLPYILCCVKEDNCEKYYEKRPSDDGSRWFPPRITGGSGDPHFLTLDDLSYTFNGYGEYTLLDMPASQFTIQVRTAPLFDASNKLTDGTVFKAFAVQDGYETIQLEIDIFNDILIYYNGKIVDLNETEILVYHRLTLIITESGYFIKSSTQINMEVQITPERNALSIICHVPKLFNGKTRGLLGNFDGDPNNDFMLPNGTILSINSTDDRLIFGEFGQKWMTTEETSIFTYRDCLQHSNFINLYYEPKFMSDGIVFENDELEEKANEICKDNQQCLFDIATTGQISIGDMTKEFDEQVEQFEELIEEVAKTCVRLNEPVENAKTTINETNNGLIYSIKCSEKYCMKGKPIVVCENAETGEFPKCLLCPEVNSSTRINSSSNRLLFFISLILLLVKKF